jgi:hypothetical protein
LEQSAAFARRAFSVAETRVISYCPWGFDLLKQSEANLEEFQSFYLI